MSAHEVIERYYLSVNAADWDTWLTLFHEEVVVDEPIGHFEGIGALQNVVTAIKRGYSKFLMHPEKTIVDGNVGAVVWRCEAANLSDEPMEVNGVNVFEVVDGKIVKMQTFFDPADFAPFLNQKLD